MARRKRIPIDDDLLKLSTEYVNAQLTIMKEHNENQPDLPLDELGETIYKCAEYPQILRNMTAKAAAKKASEDKKGKKS